MKRAISIGIIPAFLAGFAVQKLANAYDLSNTVVMLILGAFLVVLLLTLGPRGDRTDRPGPPRA